MKMQLQYLGRGGKRGGEAGHYKEKEKEKERER